jgi:hypothetical protein
VNYCVHDAYEGTYDDLKAQTIITQACTDHYSVQITHLKCAFHMWNTLLQMEHNTAEEVWKEDYQRREAIEEKMLQ